MQHRGFITKMGPRVLFMCFRIGSKEWEVSAQITYPTKTAIMHTLYAGFVYTRRWHIVNRARFKFIKRMFGDSLNPYIYS